MSDIVQILASPAEATSLRVDPEFVETHRANVDWLLDRLSKSTAGVRGLIADSPFMTELPVEIAERSSQLSPSIVALIAEAYARYLREVAGDDRPAAFVGYDARFLSDVFGEIFTRVFAGHGIRVVRDHNREATPTPVTSFMSVLLGLNGGIQITASHNPPNHNGVKSSTCYGGVDTDDISDRIAQHLRCILSQGAEIPFSALPSGCVEELDAKGLYASHYLRATFPEEFLSPLLRSLRGGAGFLFDGLHGVGGLAMRRYLDYLLGPGEWEQGIRLLNERPDPTIGGIEKPDPSDPATLLVSGAIDYLIAHANTLVSVTADMDADRIGTAILIPPEKCAIARRYGLFVTRFKGGVNAVRFTPNQIFTLIAYDRLLTATGGSPEGPGGRPGSRPGLHLITTIATSVLVEQLARRYGLQLHLTAVGFKNLGKEALAIDRSGRGDVILALMEESGGAQIGPMTPWNESGDTIHRDKDTCSLAIALYCLAARLHLQGSSVLDFYVEMARQFGALAYFERLDAYLPDKVTAESTTRAAVANRVKEELLARLTALGKDESHVRLMCLLGENGEKAARLPDRELHEVSLLVCEDGEWRDVHPRATTYALPGGDRVEFFRAGPNPHDGLFVRVLDPAGSVRHWCLVRASGTEAVVRVYMEIIEPADSPDPGSLVRTFGPLLRYLGLDRYGVEAGGMDYVTAFEAGVGEKYPPAEGD